MERKTFPTTRWTLLADLGKGDQQRREALEDLCTLYWYPLYGYVRQRGKSVEEAEDITQEFFLHLLGGGGFDRADASRGRLRSFLLGAMSRFLVDHTRRSMALKRGGGERPLHFDTTLAESRLALDATDGATPERLYYQRWAQAILERVNEAIASEYEARGRAEHFSVLQDYLFWNAGEAPYKDVAATLQLSEAAVRQAVVRMRRRFAVLLREQVAMTVGDDDEVEAEIRDLFAVFSR